MKKIKTNKTKTATPNKPTLIAVLLDRSGSMQNCKDETISGFNAYIDKASEGGDKTIVYIQQFDSQGIDVLSDCVPISKAVRLSNATFQPRGSTPLYDAMGKAIQAVSGHSDRYKILFVTMTDGLENASCEWTLQSLQSAIKDRENNNHWTFVYLGVGMAGFNAARVVSHGTIGASNVLKSDKKNLVRAYARAGGQSVNYATSIGSASASVQGFWGGDKQDDSQSK